MTRSAFLSVLALIVFLLLATPDEAHADCTSPAGVEGHSRYDFTAHDLFVCTGTVWAALSDGGSGGATSMTTGWPDAIACNDGGGTRTILYPDAFPYSGDGNYYYRTPFAGSGFDVLVGFNSSKNYVSNVNAPGDCVGQSIAALYAAGRAFNFLGGSATAAGTVAGAIQFRGGSAIFATDDVNLVWDDTNNRLGIGTTSPGQKLAVAGTIESTTGGFKFPDGTTKASAVPSCTTVTQAFSASGTSTATCSAGYTMTGGGFQCGCGNGCMAAYNHPNGNGWTAGYCFYYGGTAYGGTTYARCCQ